MQVLNERFLSTIPDFTIPGIHTVIHRDVKHRSSAPTCEQDIVLTPLLRKYSFAHILHTGYSRFFSQSGRRPAQVLFAITVINSAEQPGLWLYSASGMKK